VGVESPEPGPVPSVDGVGLPYTLPLPLSSPPLATACHLLIRGVASIV